MEIHPVKGLGTFSMGLGFRTYLGLQFFQALGFRVDCSRALLRVPYKSTLLRRFEGFRVRGFRLQA